MEVESDVVEAAATPENGETHNGDTLNGQAEIEQPVDKGDDEKPITSADTTDAGKNTDISFLFDDSSEDEEEARVTIGEIKQNLPFQKPTSEKVDMDGQPTVNGTVVYDLDLATMDEKPWQKPGADITDYFNYGFSEETWNMYCERQRKLRAEYGTQKEVNRAIMNSVNLNFSTPQPPQMTISNSGGRQLVNLVGPDKPQKASKLTVVSSNRSTPLIGQPPPSTPINLSIPMSMPMHEETNRLAPPGASATPTTSGVDEAGDATPSPLPSTAAIPSFNASVPPPGFNPSVPPPGIGMHSFGPPPTNLNVPPPLFGGPMYAAAGFGAPPFGMAGCGPPPPLLGNRPLPRRTASGDEDAADDADAERRKRRRRSSRSPSPRRHKDDKTRDYRERDRDRDRDRDYDASRSSRRRDTRDDRGGGGSSSDKKRTREPERVDDEHERERKRRKRERSDRDRDREHSSRTRSPERERRAPSAGSDAPPGIDPE